MSSDGSAGPPVSGAGGGINTGPVPDRGAPLIALLWILTAASFGPLVGRVYVRTRARKCGWEDLFMLLTIVRTPKRYLAYLLNVCSGRKLPFGRDL